MSTTASQCGHDIIQNVCFRILNTRVAIQTIASVFYQWHHICNMEPPLVLYVSCVKLRCKCLDIEIRTQRLIVSLLSIYRWPNPLSIHLVMMTMTLIWMQWPIAICRCVYASEMYSYWAVVYNAWSLNLAFLFSKIVTGSFMFM